LFNETSPEGIDLLKKMLTFNPKHRISVQEALEHPFLADLHCPDDEPAAKMVEAFDFDFEKYDLDKQ
jgi:mitogen-activated protein kinase 1/3